MKQRIRTVRFAPYMKGKGPTFILHLFDVGQSIQRYVGGGNFSRSMIGYELRIRENGNKSIIMFKGEDFGCSPLHAIDSDATVKSLMTFLTLRPGDTDRDYFKNYTPGQLAYCSRHAESLSLCVLDRFGE